MLVFLPAKAILFYTLDGSDPDSTSTKYTNPIHITKTTLMKAVSYKANLSPSPVIYETYFINENKNCRDFIYRPSL
jgi:hypothetical protein